MKTCPALDTRCEVRACEKSDHCELHKQTLKEYSMGYDPGRDLDLTSISHFTFSPGTEFSPELVAIQSKPRVLRAIEIGQTEREFPRVVYISPAYEQEIGRLARERRCPWDSWKSERSFV